MKKLSSMTKKELINEIKELKDIYSFNHQKKLLNDCDNIYYRIYVFTKDKQYQKETFCSSVYLRESFCMSAEQFKAEITA